MHTIYALLPKASRLAELAAEQRENYPKASPYPHVVIDGVFSQDLLDQILEEFPPHESAQWKRYSNPREMKLELKSEMHWGPVTRAFMGYLNSGPFLNFLSQLTRIKNLLPDPYYDGGGLHQIVRGGLLKIHADFNKHPSLRLDRRLNLLLYLNKDWEEEYRGHFEMWDKDMKLCVKKVLPIYNRMVVFSTTAFSYHGHPDPLNCPENRTRRSLALYYYTNGRPKEEIIPGLEEHGTLFQVRPDVGEQFETKASGQTSLQERVKSTVKLFLPPILLEGWRKARR
jgi:hypothetical protein